VKQAATVPCFLLAVVAGASVAAAATARRVEVAPGVEVSRTTYRAPVNQQPFYGFAELTPEQKKANAKFVAAAVKATGSRDKAFAATAQRAWQSFYRGDLATAAMRFNQAYLLDAKQSQVFHGLGLIAAERFGDRAFADELMRLARTLPNPARLLNADYGRFLLIAERPQDAEPVLEQAVADAPRFATAWSNLAWARLQNGKSAAACDAAERAAQLSPPANVSSDLSLLRTRAGCI
jgi:Tfp pilus assembly protein PilF